MSDFSQHPESVTEIRAKTTGCACAWTPRDVLIDALRRIDAGEVTPDALVLSMSEAKPGGRVYSWNASSPDSFLTLALVTRTQHLLQLDLDE